MLLGSNGQNIYPEEIEARLNNMRCVMESLIVDRNGRLVALVVPDYEQADNEGVDHAKLQEIMNENLKELNTQVAAYERIAEIMLYPTESKRRPKGASKDTFTDRLPRRRSVSVLQGETASGTAYAIPDAYVKASPYDRLFSNLNIVKKPLRSKEKTNSHVPFHSDI